MLWFGVNHKRLLHRGSPTQLVVDYGKMETLDNWTCVILSNVQRIFSATLRQPRQDPLIFIVTQQGVRIERDNRRAVGVRYQAPRVGRTLQLSANNPRHASLKSHEKRGRQVREGFRTECVGNRKTSIDPQSDRHITFPPSVKHSGAGVIRSVGAGASLASVANTQR